MARSHSLALAFTELRQRKLHARVCYTGKKTPCALTSIHRTSRVNGTRISQRATDNSSLLGNLISVYRRIVANRRTRLFNSTKGFQRDGPRRGRREKVTFTTAPKMPRNTRCRFRRMMHIHACVGALLPETPVNIYSLALSSLLGCVTANTSYTRG